MLAGTPVPEIKVPIPTLPNRTDVIVNLLAIILAVPVVVGSPTPVAVKITPIVLVAAPIKVKSVVPTVFII